MFPEKNGAIVQINSGDEPYELWSGDLYGCPTCGAQVVTAFGANAITRATERTFPQAFEAYQGGGRIVAVVQ